MAATTFYRFQDLPKELRDMVWEFAILPDIPGVHIFSVGEVSGLGDWNSIRLEFHNYKKYQDDIRSTFCCGLTAPRCLPKGIEFSRAAHAAIPASWTSNNPSMYLVDSGL